MYNAYALTIVDNDLKSEEETQIKEIIEASKHTVTSKYEIVRKKDFVLSQVWTQGLWITDPVLYHWAKEIGLQMFEFCVDYYLI